MVASWAKYDAARESVRRPGVAVPVTNGHETSLSPSRAAATKDSSVEEDFVLTKSGILAFVTLSVLTLLAALDGTSISVALPV